MSASGSALATGGRKKGNDLFSSAFSSVLPPGFSEVPVLPPLVFSESGGIWAAFAESKKNALAVAGKYGLTGRRLWLQHTYSG